MIKDNSFEQNQVIYKRMLKDIESEVDIELEEAKEQIKNVKNSLIKEVKEEQDRIIEKAEKIAKDRINKAKALIELEINRKNLLKKYKIMQKVLEMSLIEIKNYSISNPKYHDYLLHYIRKGVESIYYLKILQGKNKIEYINQFYSKMHLHLKKPVEDIIEIYIIVNKKDKKFITKEFLNELSQDFGIRIKIQLDNHIIGGAIIKISDDSTSYDSTFNGRLNYKRNELINELSKIILS